MVNIVIDTSALIAAILDEPEKESLVGATQGANLLAPNSLHWDWGNAFSALFNRTRLCLKEAVDAIGIYEQIPIQFVDVNLTKALEIADKLNIYAYDAYMIACATAHNAPLLTLDKDLKRQAQLLNVRILEI
jgi:predicted nucleic acid-binding protein